MKAYDEKTEWYLAFGGPGLSAAYTWSATLLAALMVATTTHSTPSLEWATLGLALSAAVISYPIATGFLLTTLWLALPFMWVALAWMAVAFFLYEVGARLHNRVLRVCGHATAFLAIVRLWLVSTQIPPTDQGLSLRLLTVTLTVVLLYLYARRIRPVMKAYDEKTEWYLAFGGPGLSAAYTWSATLLAALMVATTTHSTPSLEWATLGLALSAAVISYPIATGFLLTTLWLALPFMWVGLAWMGAAFLLYEVGIRLNNRVLHACGHAAALLAFLRLLYVNLLETQTLGGISLRLLTLIPAAALYYLYARRIESPVPTRNRDALASESFLLRGDFSIVFSWLGTALAGLLIWYEVANAAVGLAWALFGLALLEVGRIRVSRTLLVQGYTLLTLSFARIFIADLNASTLVGPVSARMITVVLLAAIYYMAAFTASKEFARMRTALFWFSMAALTALLRFEFVADWVAVGWAGLAVLFFLVGRHLGLETLRHQSYLLVLLVGTRCALDNFFQTGDWNFTNIRIATVAAASLLLYVLLGSVALRNARLARRGGSTPAEGDWTSGSRFARAAHWFDLHPQLLFFFVPTALITVLVSLEVPRGYLTAAWGLEGLLAFVVALLLAERSFRWFSLLLLLLCVGRIVAVDVWALDPLGRIISFMALGGALLLVSFLYARFRETWRKYL